MNLETTTKITTDCGRVFDVSQLQQIKNGHINQSTNYTFTIYRTNTKEYVQKKSFFNPKMNHTSTNYELLPESVIAQYIGS